MALFHGKSSDMFIKTHFRPYQCQQMVTQKLQHSFQLAMKDTRMWQCFMVSQVMFIKKEQYYMEAHAEKKRLRVLHCKRENASGWYGLPST